MCSELGPDLKPGSEQQGERGPGGGKQLGIRELRDKSQEIPVPWSAVLSIVPNGKLPFAHSDRGQDKA